jgi:DNA (cytosine-5)-methyltransferase 1
LTEREAARLQGLPEWFNFGDQSKATTFRQLGNGVNVGVVWHVLRRHVERDEEVLKRTAPKLVRAVLGAHESPDGVLAGFGADVIDVRVPQSVAARS